MDGKVKYLEAIKLAAGSLQYKNISVKETIILAVSQLYSYFQFSGNLNYLETATLHIQAYLEMGFSYDDGKESFDIVLKALGTTKELMFPKKFYHSKKVHLNKTQIKLMIKKWPASPRQVMRIDEVVSDILEKVKKREIGIFYYKNVVINDIYELVISEKEIFFHDLTRGIFYTFVDA